MKLTTRQSEVLQNLALVRTDGARVDAHFRLGEKNVSQQVRSLLAYGLIELRGASLIAVEKPAALTPARINTDAAVSAMRALLDK